MSRPAQRFAPRTLEDVFAIFLARELQDTSQVRFYAGLSRKYPLCALINALRQARKSAGTSQVRPAHFLEAVEALSEERVV